MNNKVKPWWQQLLIAAVIFEITYLALVNLALYLPLTQTLINQHKPEKYTVHWEKAWSWRPFRVHARGISVNGQTTSLQWQAESPAAAASVAILPLLRRTVKIHAIAAGDMAYFQRKRPKPDKDYATSRKFFPPISGRDLDEPVTPRPPRPPRKQGNGWTIVVEDIHASGSHHLWINQLQTTLSGKLQADISYQTRGGPFSLSNGKADAKIDSLTINNGQEISTEGFLKGSVKFSPFIPSENRGTKSLAFLSVDASIATRTESLEFLNFYLNSLYGMHIDGAGNLEGRVIITAGKLLPETALVVSADELDMQLKDHIARGTGDVTIKVAADKPEELGVTIHFTTMDMHHQDNATPLFTGNGLEVTVRGSNSLADWQDRKDGAAYAAVKIPAVNVPDLGRYQRYLPERLAVTLNGGQGELQGEAELSRTALNTRLVIRSDHADISFKDYRFISDLALGIHIDIPSIAAESINISGTYLRINDARLSGREAATAQPWNAALSIDEGVIDLPPPAATQNVKEASRGLRQQHFKSRLETADAHFRVSGNISELDWINLLFRNPYELTIAGSGQLNADIYLKSGWPAKGTQLEVFPRKMHVEVLDYVVKGDGLVSLKITKGGEHPDLDLQVDVNDGLFKRKGDEQSFIRDVALKLHAQGNAMGYDGSGEIVRLHLQIPSAKVTDMSVYDEYLPERSPLHILGGTADLTADIQLQPDAANGFVRLITKGLRSRMDDQEIAGELTADIKLADGNPQNMEFDISGSSLLLDKVRVTGKEQNFGQQDWNARFDLKNARAIWKKPVYIHAESEIEIKDSRPVVAMFANAKGEKKWLEKLLTIEDIQGTATVTLEQRQLTIPHAFSGSDKIDVGAKGIIDEQNVDGIFYARFRKLDAVLKVNNGKRNLGVLGARKKFDNYSTRPE